MNIASVSLPGGPDRFLLNLEKGKSRSSDVFVDRGQGEEKESFHRLREVPLLLSSLPTDYQSHLLVSEHFKAELDRLLEVSSPDEEPKIEMLPGYLSRRDGQTMYAIMFFDKRKRSMFALCDIKEGTNEHQVFYSLLARAKVVKQGLLAASSTNVGVEAQQ